MASAGFRSLKKGQDPDNRSVFLKNVFIFILVIPKTWEGSTQSPNCSSYNIGDFSKAILKFTHL